MKKRVDHPDNKFRKYFGWNIGTAMFVILLVYMIFSALIYMTEEEIDSYQVKAGPLSRNETYTGLALREEEVIKADNGGYVTYYAREGSKINATGVVYGVGSSHEDNASTSISKEDLALIRSELQSFSKGFDTSKFNSTYSFKYQLSGEILSYAGDMGYASGQTLHKASKDGIVLYSEDGFEDKTIENLKTTDFDQNAYKEINLKTKKQMKAGESAYTLITSEKWSLVVPLSDRQVIRLKDRTSIRVKFLKDDMTQTGDFSIIEIGGMKYGKIDFSRGMIRYASERFLDVELVTNTITGLKIPLTSITTKECYVIPADFIIQSKETGGLGVNYSKKNDGNTRVTQFISTNVYGEKTEYDEDGKIKSKVYYVDKKGLKEGDGILSEDGNDKFIVAETVILEGVYCINKGYAVFDRIEVLDQNEEYAVVSKKTTYGLSEYDYIVRDANNVKDQEIFY